MLDKGKGKKVNWVTYQ